MSGEYCTKEIGLDLEWDNLLQIDLLIVVYFPIVQIKTSSTCFNNPVNRNLSGSDKSRLTPKVDCLPSDALSNGKLYRHRALRSLRIQTENSIGFQKVFASVNSIFRQIDHDTGNSILIYEINFKKGSVNRNRDEHWGV